MFFRPVRRCSSADVLRPATLFKRDFNTGAFLWILHNFYEKLFYRTPPVASVDLLFLIKNDVGWFLLRFVDLVIVCYLHIISRNHSNTLLLTCRKQKLVQSKPLQQRLFVLILGFWQYRQVFVHYLRSILMYANKHVAIFIK